MKFLAYLIIYSFLILNNNLSYADIYRYVDKNGVQHFTNIPTSKKKYKPFIKVKETNLSNKNTKIKINLADKPKSDFNISTKKEEPVQVKKVSISSYKTPSKSDIYKRIRFKDGVPVLEFTNVPSSSDYIIYVKADTFYKNSISPYTTDKYDEFINIASKEHDIDAILIKAMIKVESNFQHNAVSPKGAMGLMQLIQANIDLLNIYDPFDPYENIKGGTRLFRRYLDRFNGNTKLALAAYNAGPENVDKYGKQIPPFKETEDYVERVQYFYEKFNR